MAMRWGCGRPVKQVALVVGALLLCGCQTAFVPANQPLPQNAQGMPEFRSGYALLPMLQQPQGEIVFIMAFSGGGKRSAAFAHGVLRGLRQIPVVEGGRTRSLLDELDYVAAVSGGSFLGEPQHAAAPPQRGSNAGLQIFAVIGRGLLWTRAEQSGADRGSQARRFRPVSRGGCLALCRYRHRTSPDIVEIFNYHDR